MQFMLADLNRIKTWSDSVDWNELTKGDSGGAASGYGELLGLGGWRLAQRRWRHGRRKQHGDAEVASADASAQTANQRFHRLIHASAQTEKMRRRVPFGRRCHLHPSNQIISHHRYITSWLQLFITPINDQSTTNQRPIIRPFHRSRGDSIIAPSSIHAVETTIESTEPDWQLKMQPAAPNPIEYWNWKELQIPLHEKLVSKVSTPQWEPEWMRTINAISLKWTNGFDSITNIETIQLPWPLYCCTVALYS